MSDARSNPPLRRRRDDGEAAKPGAGAPDARPRPFEPSSRKPSDRPQDAEQPDPNAPQPQGAVSFGGGLDHDAPHPMDERVNQQLDALLKSKDDDAPDVQEAPLKRQWDDDLEAQLEAAMEGFDEDSFQLTGRAPRTRAQDRSHVDKADLGRDDMTGYRPGRVVKVRGESVFVDIGGKSEGIVPIEQFTGDLPELGTVIEVRLDRYDRQQGIQMLSLRNAAIKVDRNWDNLQVGAIVEARVTKALKAGVEVEVGGIRGFMPISQIDVGRVEDPAVFLNERFNVEVTEANPRQRNLVVSRRSLLERERAELREKTWAELEEGQIRSGVVRSIKEYGAFVDIGGVDGLIHVSDIAWGRVNDIKSILHPNQAVEVKVLRIDGEAQKVALGLKQLTRSPWDDIELNYGRGQVTQGTVTRVADFGAFVELEPGLEGLVHISELSPNRVQRTSQIVKVGQEVEVRILSIDTNAQRIALSMKPLPGRETLAEEDEPEEEAPRPKPKRTKPLKGGLG